MFFKKKKKEEDDDQEIEESETSEEPENKESNPSSEANAAHMTAELEKIKAQISSLKEMQKASGERFSRITEQTGELRAMIMDRDKDAKLVEAKATQAIDLVQSVQPDKLMIELKKTDNRIEMLKSHFESNEVVVSNAVNELKELRTKINAFKGVEESIKLADEVKREWMENKKIDANITKHASKVETIYSEMWKKFSGFEKFQSVISDLDKAVKQTAIDLDSIKVKITSFSDKKEIENLINKFENYGIHTNSVLSALDKRINNFDKEFGEKFNEKMEKATTLLNGFKTLAEKTPDLDKYFNLLEQEAKKNKKKDVKVEKIKTPGQDEEPKEDKKK